MTVNKKILLLVFSAMCIGRVNAQWTADPTVNTPICATAGSQQMFQQLTSDKNGGAFFVWMETTPDMTSSRIFAQHLSAAGTKLWAAGGIEISNGSGVLTNPLIAPDGSGGAIISWVNQVGIVLNFYMQRVSSSGQILWTPGGVLVTDITQTPLPSSAQLMADGLGGAFMTWDDTREGNNRVYGQHIDGNGNRVWAAAGLPLTPSFTDLFTYDAVPDNKSGLILCFLKQSGLLNLHEVYVQHINEEGIAQWGNDGKNLSNVPGDQLYCKIAKDTNDHVIVIWQDHRLDPVWSQIYGQRVDSVGDVQWGPTGKLLVDSVAPQYGMAQIVTDTRKGAVITWHDKFTNDSDTAHLYAIRIDSTGSPIWLKREMVSWLPWSMPDVYELVPDYKGGAYVSFLKIFSYGFNASFDAFDVGAQHVLPNGSLEFSLSGMPVSSVPMNQVYQQLMCDSNGLAVVAWTDLRSMVEYDLYAMRIGMPATLPVTWVNFSGKLQVSSVLLTWETSDEVNNTGFTIQRSRNGAQFDNIGFKPAAAPGAATLYSYKDLVPLVGTNFYRLKQTDIDGKIAYSRVVRIEVGTQNWLRLYPNPAKEKIVVSGARPGSRLLIYDVGGRIWKKLSVSNSIQEIYIHDLPPGTFYLVEEGQRNSVTVFIRN